MVLWPMVMWIGLWSEHLLFVSVCHVVMSESAAVHAVMSGVVSV